MDLENRLNGIDRNALVTGITTRTHDDRKLRLAADFAEKFGNYCKIFNITFIDGTDRYDAGRIIGNKLHKKLLEPIYYGMCQSTKIPGAIISKLTPWETAYFFAGINSLDPKYNGNIPDFTKEPDGDKVVAQLLLRGIDILGRRHLKAQVKKPKHLSKTITSELQLTGEGIIRSNCYSIINRPAKPTPKPQSDLFGSMPFVKPAQNDDYCI